MGVDRDLVDLRVGRGCRAFVGCVGGQVVTYGWLSTQAEWIGELGLEIRPPGGEAYIWNCVTLPEHRLHGYFRALIQHLVATAQAEGLTRLWIGAVDGGAEIAVIETGFRPALHLRTLTVAGLRRVTVVPPEDGEPRLVAAATAALGSGRAPLRSRWCRVRTRRH